MFDGEKFVQNVQFYCSRRGVNATTALRESGLTRSTLSNARTSVPSVDKVQALAFYFGVTTSDLLGETQPAAMDGLTDDERELIRIHDALPEDLRENLLSVARGLAMLPADGHTPAKSADAPASDAGSTGPMG